jgi:hypothetical protein
MALIAGLWKDVEFGRTDLGTIGMGGLKRWSEMTGAEGDPKFKERLDNAGPARKMLLQFIGQKPEDFLGLWGWIKKVLFWKKRVVLEVEGVPGTHYAVGFYDHHLGLCKISTAVRDIDDGPFQMRVGPGNIHFFVVADAEVKLRNRGCFYANTRLPSEMGFLHYDLY